jgi:hypothetical protein
MNILNLKAFGGLLFLRLVMAALLFIPAVDARLLAGVGISRCIFLVGAGDHRVPNEKGPETPRAAGPRRTNRREGDKSKDHPIDHVFRIYCDACYPRA